MAPIETEYSVIFSFLKGIKHCIPINPLMEIIIIIGFIIFITGIDGIYSVPLKIKVIGSLSRFKPIVAGIATPKVIAKLLFNKLKNSVLSAFSA